MSKYVYIAMSVFLLSVAVNAQVSYSITLKPVKCVYEKTRGQTDYYQCEDKRGREYKRENLLKEPNPHKVLYGCGKKGDYDGALWNSPRKCDELTKKFNKENKEILLHDVPYKLGENIANYIKRCQSQYEEKLRLYKDKLEMDGYKLKMDGSELNKNASITWSDIGMKPIRFEKDRDSIFIWYSGSWLSLKIDACGECFVCQEPQYGQGLSIVLDKDFKQSDCKRGLTITRNISDNDSWLPVKVTSPKRGDVCSESLKESFGSELRREIKFDRGTSKYEAIPVGDIGDQEHKHYYAPNVWYQVRGPGKHGCFVIQKHTGVKDALTYVDKNGTESKVLKKGPEGDAGDGLWNNISDNIDSVVKFKFEKGGMYDLRVWEGDCVYDADELIDSWIREKEKTGTFVQTESDPCENLTDKAEYVLARCSALPESNRLEKTGDCLGIYKQMNKERIELGCLQCKDLTPRANQIWHDCFAMSDKRRSYCERFAEVFEKEKGDECHNAWAKPKKNIPETSSAQAESDRCKDLTNLVRYLHEQCSALPKGGWERKNCIEDYNYNKKRREQECLSGAEKKTDARDGKKNKTGTFVQSESDPCKELTDKARNLFEKCTALPEGNQSRERKDCMKEYRRVKKEEKRACH